MVYLVHVKIGYYDFYYKFDFINHAVEFVEHIKIAKVTELSDDAIIKTTIEALTVKELEEKIKNMEGE